MLFKQSTPLLCRRSIQPSFSSWRKGDVGADAEAVRSVARAGQKLSCGELVPEHTDDTCVINRSRRETSLVQFRQWGTRSLLACQLFCNGGGGKLRRSRSAIDDEQPSQDKQHDGDDEQAAFGSISASAPKRISAGRRGEQMAGSDQSTIGSAVEVSFGPVPCSVGTYGPPC